MTPSLWRIILRESKSFSLIETEKRDEEGEGGGREEGEREGAGEDKGIKEEERRENKREGRFCAILGILVT